jgi:PAS domain S-box-containing protein
MVTWLTLPSFRARWPIVVFAVGYCFAYLFGNSLQSPAPLWPPDAVLLAALLLTSPRRWWMYVLVTIPIRLLPALAPGMPLWLLLLNLVNDSFKGLLAALLVRSFLHGRPRFARLRECVIFVSCAVVAAPLLSACVGAAGRAALGAAYWPAWVTWFLGDALANLVLVPAILLWAGAGVGGLRAASRLRALEALAIGATLAVMSVWIFARSSLPLSQLEPHLYLIVPVLLWSAVEFGPRGIASVLALFALLAMVRMADVQGLFTFHAAPADVLALQVFLLTIGSPFFFLAALTQEREEVGAALRESEARFRASFESAAVGMMLVDLDGHPLQVNRAMVEQLGYSEEELRTHTFADFTYPDDVDTNLEQFHRVLAGEIDHYHLEKRYIHRDGHCVWGHLSAGVVRDAVGRPLYLVGHVQDITRRKQAELALRASETQYRAVVQHLPQSAVLLFGEDMRHVFADGPALAAGLALVEIEGRTVWEAFPTDLAAAFDPSYRAALAGQQVSFDLEHGQYTYHVDVVPMASFTLSSSSVRAGMAVLQDVTEQRRARRELERQQTLAAWFGALSQEFRTLAEHSPDLIARFDGEGCLRYINPAGLAMLGSTPEECLGKTVAELGPRACVLGCWQRALDVFATGTTQTLDIEVAGADDWVRALRIRYIPEWADEHTVASVLGIATDLTELKQIEARLVEQANQLEAIFEAQADGVGVYDMQGQFLRANRALHHLFGHDADSGYTALSLAERAQRLLLYDEQGQRIPEEQWPQWRVLRGELLAGASAIDVLVQTLDGRQVWVSTTGAPIRAADGQITGVVLIARDVTARRALERQAQEQANQLEAIFEAMTDGVFVLDADGRVTRMNPAAQSLFGRALGEAVPETAEDRTRGLNLRDSSGQLLLAGELPTSRLLRGDVLAGPTALTLQLRTHDGHERIVSLTGGPLQDAGGYQMGAVGVFRDVTRIQQMQRALAEQERLFRTLVEHSPDVITRFDPALRHVYVSPRAEVVLGIPAHDRVGKTYTELGLPEALFRPWEQALQKVFATGEPCAFDTTSPFGEDSWQLHYYRVRYIPEVDADGSVATVLSITTDITELRQTEQRLADQERQYRTLVENSPDIIVRYDRQLRHVYVSPSLAAVSGVPAPDFLGKTTGDFGLPDERYGGWKRELQRVLTTGERHTFEFDYPGLDGARSYLVRVIPERPSVGSGAEGIETVLTITTDITELKQAEEALQAAIAALEAARQEEARRRQEAEHREKIAESLRGVLAILNSKRPRQEILRYIVRQVGYLLGSEAAAILGVERALGAPPLCPLAEALALQAAVGLRVSGQRRDIPQRLPFAYAAIQQAMASESPVAVLDVCVLPTTITGEDRNTAASISLLRGTLPAPYHALLIVPIHVQTDIYGCLLLFYTQPCQFSAEELALALAYADQAGLAITNARLQAHIEQEAGTAERSRLAHELHDTVTQEIFSASLLAESLPRIWEKHRPQAEVALQQVHMLIQSAQAGLRALLLELRPGELEQAPLAEAIEKLCAAMMVRAGGPVTVDIAANAHADFQLPAAVKVAFYRVAQEALMNAIKHAQARAFRLRLRTQSQGHVELEVADDGQGFDPGAIPVGHFGLAMMRERAQAVGARVQIRSQVGHGSQVVVTWTQDAQVAPTHRKETTHVRTGTRPHGRSG